jgi:hypothetical protein
VGSSTTGWVGAGAACGPTSPGTLQAMAVATRIPHTKSNAFGEWRAVIVLSLTVGLAEFRTIF